MTTPLGRMNVCVDDLTDSGSQLGVASTVDVTRDRGGDRFPALSGRLEYFDWDAYGLLLPPALGAGHLFDSRNRE